MSLFGRRGRSGKSASAEAGRKSEIALTPEGPSDPPLVLLVADASGRASFKLHSFQDVQAAKEFIRYWFRGELEGGVVAFWALTEEPARTEEPEPTEPLVLIRDAEKQGVVYLFSFVDIEAAHSFAQAEVEAGASLGSLLIYWAAAVRIEVDTEGSVRLTPDSPPSGANVHYYEESRNAIEVPAFEAPPASGWARVIGCNMQVSQPAAEPALVASVATALDAAPVATPAPESIAAEEPAPVAAAKEAAPVKAQASVVRSRPKRTSAHRPRKVASERFEPMAEAEMPEPNGKEPPSWFEAKDGEPPREGNTWRNDGFHDIDFDMERELAKVLQVKRWEVQDAPFQGFESPPGRF